MQVYKSVNPIVSIIIPTYNRADYLNRAIDSVINQTFKNWELLIIDDGSTDATFDIVNEYIIRNENIRYLKQSNEGLALAYNTGILVSSGIYLTFLGSDDEYKQNHLQARIDYMKNHPEISLIHGGVEIIGDPYIKDKYDLSRKIHISECAVGGTFFGSREMFIELNGFQNVRYGEDAEFLIRAEAKYNISKIDIPTYIYYRDTPDSICNTIKEV
jgi:glycosyltransferase involved in cell wall biosynthesis